MLGDIYKILFYEQMQSSNIELISNKIDYFIEITKPLK